MFIVVDAVIKWVTKCLNFCVTVSGDMLFEMLWNYIMLWSPCRSRPREK